VKSLLAVVVCTVSVGASDRPALLFSRAEAASIRDAVRKGEAWTAGPAGVLRAAARRSMSAGPWSVTPARPQGMKIDVHDYYSEGPYWWPDPKNPGGPYIRHDGRTNPDRFTANKNALTSMTDAAISLGAAAYFLGDEGAARRAVLVLRTWFLDPATRMNPHLEYGQAVRGHNTGRASGIIDTRSLIHAAQGIELLDLAGGLDPAVRDGLRGWFAAYTKWLTTSRNGLGEKKSGNNHASWWVAQVAAYAGFAGDSATQEMAFRWFREGLFPKQIEPDGSAPREEARTKSLGYSTFNLEAYMVLCRIAERAGTNLWDVHTAKGATIGTAVDYLLPALGNPASWKKEQIVDFKTGDMYYLGLAGVGLRRPELVRFYRERERPGGAWQAVVDLLLPPTQ
jgi:hypothetical protein